MRIKTILFIVAFPVFILKGAGIDPVHMGDRFFCAGELNSAITEYKRYICFNNPESNRYAYCHFRIGQCYKYQAMWNQAVAYTEKAIENTQDPSMRDQRKMELALIHLAAGNPSVAKFILLKLKLFGSPAISKKKIAFFIGVSAVYGFEWEEAESAFSEYVQASNTDPDRKWKTIDSLITQAKKTRYRSPRFAKTLSTFIPGTGQIYAGKPIDGLNSLLIHGGVIFALAYKMTAADIFHFLVNSILILKDYYRGNRLNAEKHAKEYNQKKRRYFAAKIMEVLLNEANSDLVDSDSSTDSL